MKNEELIDKIKEKISDVDSDVDITSSRNNKQVSYGLAYIKIPPDVQFPCKITYKKEGQEEDSKTFQTIEELINWSYEVLKTGRTIECGKGAGIQNNVESWPIGQQTDHIIKYLVDRIDEYDLNPDYQRDNVWTIKQTEQFLGYFLEGCPVNPIYVQRYRSEKNAPKNHWDLPEEIIDGKQRITAFIKFINGEVPAELSDGRKVWYKDFNEVEQRMVPTIKFIYVDLDRVNRLKFYMKLNRGGTIHTEEEIENVKKLLENEECKSKELKKE